MYAKALPLLVVRCVIITLHPTIILTMRSVTVVTLPLVVINVHHDIPPVVRAV